MDENLIWEDFVDFLKLIQNCWQTKQHAFETYLDLTKSLWSWFNF
jgi:hypothetical protein